MTLLLCRNKVTDYDQWWVTFSSHATAHRDSGLELAHLWRSETDPNDVWFVFEVTDEAKARAFISAPEAEEAARETNVIESEYHFVVAAAGY